MNGKCEKEKNENREDIIPSHFLLYSFARNSKVRSIIESLENLYCIPKSICK